MTLDEGAGGQVLDKAAVNAGGGGKIKAGQGFLFITTGELELAGQALLAAAFQFIVQQQGQEIGWD